MGESRSVIFQWGASSYFGWGIIGLNLMLEWVRRRQGVALCASTFFRENMVVNALEAGEIEQSVVKSRELAASLERYADNDVNVSSPVLHALGIDLKREAAAVHKACLWGTRTIGIPVFIQLTDLAAARERAKPYSLLLAASSWNREILEGLGIGPVALMLQGIDPTHFHPAPRAGVFGGRFAVFSGGKLEHRKAQDLVIQAFKIFAARHPEALLVTAWDSPFARHGLSLARNEAIVPPTLTANDELDIIGWTEANGIPRRQVLHLGKVPNAEMPRIMREMDVAVFPNRCEPATNLVAMEIMGCGVPVILSRNTGHRDLIEADNCYVLESQREIPGAGTEHWGESDVDELVAALETAFDDRAGRTARGARGAAKVAGLSWARMTAQLADAIAA
jgi:glycosyltransferase involved in cell wall biosynthesis